MDDPAVGRFLRAVRIRRDLRQADVAILADVPQSCVSLAERGHLEKLRLGTLRAIARALESSLPFEPRWSSGDARQLLDRDHAALVELVAATLRDLGWEIVLEYSFNHFGERGSVDLVAWHPQARALLLVEAKTRIIDLQDLYGTFARKVRIVPPLLFRERGWQPRCLGKILVLWGTSANRTAVARHAASFEATFPGRGHSVRAWLREPKGEFAGLWFFANSGPDDGMSRRGAVRRVRRPRATASGGRAGARHAR